jgi:hypothetical protein
MRINIHASVTGDCDDTTDLEAVIQEIVAAVRAKFELVRWSATLHVTTPDKFDAALARAHKQGKW